MSQFPVKRKTHPWETSTPTPGTPNGAGVASRSVGGTPGAMGGRVRVEPGMGVRVKPEPGSGASGWVWWGCCLWGMEVAVETRKMRVRAL